MKIKYLHILIIMLSCLATQTHAADSSRFGFSFSFGFFLPEDSEVYGDQWYDYHESLGADTDNLIFWSTPDFLLQPSFIEGWYFDNGLQVEMRQRLILLVLMGGIEDSYREYDFTRFMFPFDVLVKWTPWPRKEDKRVSPFFGGGVGLRYVFTDVSGYIDDSKSELTYDLIAQVGLEIHVSDLITIPIAFSYEYAPVEELEETEGLVSKYWRDYAAGNAGGITVLDIGVRFTWQK